MATKTKKPTGLSISRDGNQYTFKWKISAKDYGAGQIFKYRVNTGTWSKWTQVSVTAKATSVTVTVSNVKAIKFKIKGRQQAYTSGDKTVTPAWSDSVEKAWSATVPKAPSVSYERTSTNAGTFSWSYSVKTATTESFTHTDRQTCLCRTTENPPASGWSTVVTGGASGSQAITEQTEDISKGPMVRWYRVRTVGPAGASAWSYARHAYSAPYAPVIDKVENVYANYTAGVSYGVSWRSAADIRNPIDKIVVQYLDDVPAQSSGSSLIPPSNGSWVDAIGVTPNGGYDKVMVNNINFPEEDHSIWTRIRNLHDERETISGVKAVYAGTLAAPEFNAAPNPTTGNVVFTIDEQTDCDAAKTVIFYRPGNNPSDDMIIDVLPRGSTGATIAVPEIIGVTETCFGAYAYIGTTGTATRNGRQITIPANCLMRSAAVLDSDITPVEPEITNIVRARDNAARVSWSWTWEAATAIEIAWAQYDDAWESNEAPSSYTVENKLANSWVITGITPGTWYFRMRFLLTEDDETIEGPWTDIRTFNMNSAPDRPVLSLNKSVINGDEPVTASWSYASTDGSAQAGVELSITSEENTDTLQISGAGQSAEIPYEWEMGQRYDITIKVFSETGNESIESQAVTLAVAPIPEITLGELQDITGYPYTIGVNTNIGDNGSITLSIVRAEDYHIIRPDDKELDGYEGELVYTATQDTGSSFVLTSPDVLVGAFDDGAKYTVIATVTDEYGQSAEASQDITVNWTHKAFIPEAVIQIDDSAHIAIITPMSEDAEEGDTCDIYRLTADQPELIYQGAEFGSSYVDPYPAFGASGGHRIVTRTYNGDYVTADGEIAWLDCDSDLGDFVDEQQIVIDVSGDRIELPYDITLSNQWQKDFERTTYLGGAVQGDWNPAVTRDLQAGTVLVKGDDLDAQLSMRDLAGYAGIAHVRTPDGSSFAADIQIQEDADYSSRKVSYSLTISAIDPEEPEGMTLAEWEEMYPPGGD